MNNMNRNMRTLILCFVIAIMALIPLRFVEVGQQLGSAPYVQVLGTVDQNITEPVELIQESVLEAPYNEIENQQVLGTQVAVDECIAASDAEVLLGELQTRAVSGQLSSVELDQVISDLITVESSVCK